MVLGMELGLVAYKAIALIHVLFLLIQISVTIWYHGFKDSLLSLAPEKELDGT